MVQVAPRPAPTPVSTGTDTSKKPDEKKAAPKPTTSPVTTDKYEAPTKKPTHKTSQDATAKHNGNAGAAHLQHQLHAKVGDDKGHDKDGGHGHSPVDKAHHAAHLAHEVHLAAEGGEVLAHTIKHTGEYAKQLNGAQKLASAHGQMANDLRKMSRGITKLENAVNNGEARRPRRNSRSLVKRMPRRRARSKPSAPRCARPTSCSRRTRP